MGRLKSLPFYNFYYYSKNEITLYKALPFYKLKKPETGK